MGYFFAGPSMAVAAEAASSAGLAVCESSGSVVCPRPRHTLASTAALFLPDKSSPILLAPSEIEIQDDPHYYIFGAQLVTALVLFSIAYFLAHVILNSVRQRERQAKQQWKAERKEKRAIDLQGRIPTLHPTLYNVAPALPLAPTPFSLDLSEPVVSTTLLARAKRRVRYLADWLMYIPIRIKRRLRIDKKAKLAKVQHQAAQARRLVVSAPTRNQNPPQTTAASKLTLRQRLSKMANISALISRATPSAVTQSPLSSDADDAIDDSITMNLILGSFTSMLPTTLPWLQQSADDAPLAAPKPNRRGSITDRFSEWTAALSGNMAAIQAAPTPAFTPLERTTLRTPHQPMTTVGEQLIRSRSPPGGVLSSPSVVPSTGAYFSDVVDSHFDLPSSSSHHSHADFPSVENEREFLTYSLATFVLAVALIWLELLVLSVLASTSLHGVALNQTYAFSWCTKELVGVLWVGTVWMSSISLFVLAPFGFLYYEAEGLGGRAGFVSRVSETLLVLSAFTVLLYGSFHLLQSLLDRGGLLHPFTYTHAPVAPAHPPLALPLEEFGVYDLFLETSFGGVGTLWKWLYANLEALYSNVWHFLPGLMLLLMTCHHGFIALISDAYSIGVPWSAAFTVVVTDSTRRQQHALNVIKLELSTAERKWQEMEVEWTRIAHHRMRHGSTGHARAIAPSTLVPHARSAAVTAKERRALLARIHELRHHHEQVTRSMEPTSWYVRLRTSPYVRNTIWATLTVIALLLTWHIVLRVAQREARLIFRGSIFRWFRADDTYEAIGQEEVGAGASIMRGAWSILHQLKNLLGLVLSVLTGRGLTKATSTPMTFAATTLPAASSSSSLSPPAPLFDSPLLNGIFEFFRLLASVLLGINGFHHPLVAFLVDVSCVGFFLFASAHRIYASPFLARFSPVHHYRTQARGSSTNAMLLFSPQFFTVNVVLLLLLASSLPLATWMLGLSSFDLLEFYPHSSVQFAAGSASASSATSVPLFVHLYNLAFLALTGWHISVLSKNLIVWVVFDQIVARIEFAIERVRVALGWADRNARPEARFKLFGRCRRASNSPPRTRWQMAKHVLHSAAILVQRLVGPFARYGWIVVRQVAWVVLVVASWAWLHISAFVRGELEDDAEEVPPGAAAASRESPLAEGPSGVPPASALGRSDSSFTTQMLAEIDAAAATADEKTFDSMAALPTPLLSPSRRQGSLGFFTRSTSAPARVPEVADANTSFASSSMNDSTASDDVDPLLGQTPSDYSPLYRSATTWTSRAVRRSRDYFLTPGLVPETSRKLPTEDVTVGAKVALQRTPSGDFAHVTEADFPTFPTSPIATIDEEKDYLAHDDQLVFEPLSADSSTVGTPRLSPFAGLTPNQHRLALSALEHAALDLSCTSGPVEDAASESRAATPLALRHRLSEVESDVSLESARRLSEFAGLSGDSSSASESDRSASGTHADETPPPDSPSSDRVLLPAASLSSRVVSQSTSSGSDSE